MIDFDTVAMQCAPHVAPSTLRAMASVESGFNRYAMGIVDGRLVRQPRHLVEAITTARELQSKQVKFSAGLVQIYVKNWAAYNLDAESVFDPCANLRAAQGILSDCYRRATKTGSQPQVALRQAISCYYSNNFVTGFNHGYVQKVIAAASKFEALASTQAPVQAIN